MKFEKIKFNQRTAQGVYDGYMKRIEEIVQPLPRAEQLDILMEMNSHIYEGMQNSNIENELDCLLSKIKDFGNLELMLQPIVAERKLAKATKAPKPAHLVKSIVQHIQSGVFFTLITICSMGLGFFGIATIAKLISPEQIGMYYKPGEYFVLAGMPGDNVNQLEYELLGNWYVSVMILVMFTFFVLITLILRLEKYLKNKQTPVMMLSLIHI